MDSSGFENISTNCDILIHIYKMLKFEDQLRLAQVSAALKSIFENFIWTVNYRILTVYERGSVYIVTNETNRNRLLLDPKGFQEFLRFYAESVQELTSDSPLDMRQFKHITSLRCDGNFFGMEFIQFVAEKLPHLVKFHAKCERCIDIEHMFAHHEGVVLAHEPGVLDVANVESLLTMRHLKELRLDFGYSNPHITIKYQHFCEIIYNMKLDLFKLSFAVEPDGEAGCTTIAKPVSLRELDITVSFDRQKWSSNFTSFLELFANISRLTLSIPHEDEVRDETVAIIATSCQNLVELNLRYVYFKNIKSFAIPPKVAEFHMERCYGLSHKNLKQILAETRITKFVSQYTDYEGVFEDFRISPTIQTLSVDNVDMSEFRSAYDGNENLKNLTWYPQGEYGNVPKVVAVEPLTTCCNLETLIMCDSHLALDTLLQLKRLHTLTTCLKLPMEWVYISALLRHPSLHELTLKIADNQILDTLDSPAEGFRTNVTSLRLDYSDSFASDIEFWLNLFCQNPKMKLTIYRLFMDEDDIRKLISHTKFPTSLRTVDIYGFTINCDDLRRNFNVIMEKLGNVKYEYGVDDGEETKYKFGIILCRK